MALQRLLRRRRYICILVIIGFITFLITTTINKEYLSIGGQTKMNITEMSNREETKMNEKEGCQVKYIDPFFSEIMKYIDDVNEQNCTHETRVQVNSIVSSNILLSATDIDIVRMRQVADDAKAGFHLGEFVNFGDHLHESLLALSKGKSGAIRNFESKACILPVKYNRKVPPNEIELIFSDQCETKDAIFTYTSERFIKHKQTGKCFRPKGGTDNPAPDTLLVLSGKCQSKFNVINHGILQLDGSHFCVHVSWGDADEGEKISLYPECNPMSGLTYHWFYDVKSSKHLSTKKWYPLTTDMCQVQVELLNDEVIDRYVLWCVPGPTPTTKSLSVRPNIVVICIEEASAAHFKRKLRDASVVMSEMGFIEYKMHAAVSQFSPINLVAILNGISGMQKEEKGSQTLIFKLAKEHNYISMVTADDPSILDEMKKSLDVHHSSLPFFRFLKEEYKAEEHDYCVNGQPMHDLTFNYLTSFLSTYPYHAKLAVTLLSELCRSNANNLGYLGYLDKYMTQLLAYVNRTENTIILIQSFKGGQTPMLLKLQQGVEEIKRPLLATYVSKDIQNKYRFEETRSDQLSTPLDIHATLRHLITSQEGSHPYGRSLLKTTEPRNCRQAGVYSAMCPCI